MALFETTTGSGLGPHLIDVSASTPLYHQIFLILKERIRRGDFAAGDLLPGEEELARQFNVSRITAKRALNDLASEQLVARRRGRGTVVLGGMATAAITGSFDTLVRSLERMGADTDVELLEMGENHAVGEVADLLHVEAGGPVLRIVRLRRLEGDPFSHVVTYLPERVAARINRRNLRSKPMLSLLRAAGVAPADAEQWISAVAAEPRIAAALGVPAGSPLLRIIRVVRDQDGAAIQLIYAHYRPERFSYHIQAVAMPHDSENG